MTVIPFTPSTRGNRKPLDPQTSAEIVELFEVRTPEFDIRKLAMDLPTGPADFLYERHPAPSAIFSTFEDKWPEFRDRYYEPHAGSRRKREMLERLWDLARPELGLPDRARYRTKFCSWARHWVSWRLAWEHQKNIDSEKEVRDAGLRS